MAKFKLQEACNRAKEALERGDSERAIAMCQHIVRYYPRCVEAYRLLGEAYLERGDTVTADKLFNYVVQADPQNVLAHIGRAIIREERGDIDAAIGEFEQALEIDPAIGELREELLRLYTTRFGSEGAKIRTTRVGLAHLYARDYLFPQAVNEYNDILRSQPRFDVRVALALTLWRAGNDEAAADLCNAILQQVPNNLQANLILGQIWLAQGQRDDALSLLRRAMDLDPDNALARNIYESRASRIMLPPLTYYAAELPKWDGSELTVSSELPVGLSEVVELEESKPTDLDVPEAPAAAAVDVEERSAVAIGSELATMEQAVEAEAAIDATPAWLLSEAPVVETAYPADEATASVVASAESSTQRQRLDRSDFLQRLASASMGLPTADSEAMPTSDEAASTAAAADETPPAVLSPQSIEEPSADGADWLEQLAAQTRFDAEASSTVTPSVDLSRPRERGFLDELLDGEEEDQLLNIVSTPVSNTARPPHSTDPLFASQVDDSQVVADAEAVSVPEEVATDETAAAPLPADTRLDAAATPMQTEAPRSAEDVLINETAARSTIEAGVTEAATPTEEPLIRETATAPVDDVAQLQADTVVRETTTVPAEVAAPAAENVDAEATSFISPQFPADDELGASKAPTDVEAPAEDKLITPAAIEDEQPTTIAAGEEAQQDDEQASSQPAASSPPPSDDEDDKSLLAKAGDVVGTVVSGAISGIGGLFRRKPSTGPLPEDAATSEVADAPTAESAPVAEAAANVDTSAVAEATTLARAEDELLTETEATSIVEDEAVTTAETEDVPVVFLAPTVLNAASRGASEAEAAAPLAEADVTPLGDEAASLADILPPADVQAAMPPPAAADTVPPHDVLEISTPAALSIQPSEEAAVAPPAPPLAELTPIAVNQASATQQTDILPTNAIYTQEDAMAAPSYAEDDEQGRTFEFDWEKEGLPDYLKEFALGESSNLSPPEPSAQGSGSDEGLPAWLSTPTPPAPSDDTALPAWLITPPPTQPSVQASSAVGNMDIEGLPASLPTAQPAQPSSNQPVAPASSDMGNMDMEGLPSWLSAAQPTASPPPAAPASEFGDLDMAGLPDWLSTAQPSRPPQVTQPAAPVPPAAPSGDIGNLGDGEGLPAWLTSAQSAAPGSPNLPPSSVSAADLDFDMEGIPDWLAAAPPTPAAQAEQAMPATAQPTTPSDSAMNALDMAGLPDWLSAAPSSAATPPAQPPATSPGLGDMADLEMEGLPSWLAPTPAAGQSAPASSDSGGARGMNDLAVEGLPSWLSPGTAAQSPTAVPSSLQPFTFEDENIPSTPLPAASVQPFTYDDSGSTSTGLGGVQPFSFADSGGDASGLAGLQPFSFDEESTALGGVQPFNPADLDETAPAVPANAPSYNFEDNSTSPVAAMPNLQPFSFDDIDFSPPAAQASTAAPATSYAAPSDELADLEDFVDFLKPVASPAPGQPTATVPSSPALADISSDLQPFSFDDFDITPPTAPAVSQATTPTSSDFDMGGLQPFSLDDIGFGEPPTRSAAAAPVVPAQDYVLPSNLQPFSLADSTTAVPPTAADFGPLTTPPSVTPAADFAIPTDLQPFSFDDFDMTAAADNAAATPPTADLADYSLPRDLQPFSFGNSGSPTPARAVGDGFDFAPFSFDELMQESTPAQDPPTTVPSLTDLGLNSITRPATERPSMLDEELADTGGDVRNFSWQQSPNRQPTSPLVQSSPEDEGASMFAKLRRRKEELERNEPLLEETASSVPAVGAPLTAEERDELAAINWPLDLQDTAPAQPATAAASVQPLADTDFALPADGAIAMTRPTTISDDFDLSSLDRATPTSPDANDAALPSRALSPAEQAYATPIDSSGDNFDLSGLDLSPEERAYLLGEDVEIAGLAQVRQMQEQAGIGEAQPSVIMDDILMSQDGAMAEAETTDALNLDFMVPATEQEGESAIGRDFTMPAPQAQQDTQIAQDFAMPMNDAQQDTQIEQDFAMPMNDAQQDTQVEQDFAMPMSEAQQDTQIEQDFAMPTPTMSEAELDAAIGRDFAQPSLEHFDEQLEGLGISQFEADLLREFEAQSPSRSDDYAMSTAADTMLPAADTTFTSPPDTVGTADHYAATSTPVEEASSRDRWVDFLASPPRPPIEISTSDVIADVDTATPEFVDMYEMPIADTGATEVAAADSDYVVLEEPTTFTDLSASLSDYVPPASPFEPTSTYVSPAAPSVPPSAYVPPAPPLYLDNRPPATVTPTLFAEALADADIPTPPSASQADAPTEIVAPVTQAAPTFVTPSVQDSLTSISSLRSYVDDHKDDLTARLTLARAYANNDEAANALEQYGIVIKNKATPAPVVVEVVADLQEMMSSEDVNNNPRAHRLLGDAYMKQGLFQHAISQYNWLLNK